MTTRHFYLTMAGVTALMAPNTVIAQRFEGVITHRTISVDRHALSEREFDVSEALFAVPIERVLALRPELEGDGAMTVEEMRIYIKGDLVRNNMVTDEGPMYVTMDLATGTLRMFQPMQEMYIEFTRADMERMAAMGGGMPGVGGGEDVTPVATGETRTINGLRATAYDLETEEGMTRVWVSTDDAALAATFFAMGEQMKTMAMMGDDDVDGSFAVAQHGFPVLVQRLSYDTYEIDETVSVERQPVSDDLFTPPAGWRKMSMADMMRGR